MIQSPLSLFTIFSGIFLIMALSNAIVPVLPGIGGDLQMQTYLFSAYFLGAMIMTLPGGIISDRVGQGPVLASSLLITFLSGILLFILHDPGILVLVRVGEGVGAGLFVSAALSWINYQRDHLHLAGIFMALLNGGLLCGLIAGGWIDLADEIVTEGVLLFTLLFIPVLSILPLILPRRGVRTREATIGPPVSLATLIADAGGMVIREWPLWYSVIILLGMTGFVQAIYPEISSLPPARVSMILAGMNLATIISTLLAPRIRTEPVLLIRMSAVLMAGFVLIFPTFWVAVVLIGFVAGVIIISQIHYLSVAEEHQGIAMGLFSTAQYAGMTIIPGIGGGVAAAWSVMHSSVIIVILALISVITIGWCRCRGFVPPDSDVSRL